MYYIFTGLFLSAYLFELILEVTHHSLDLELARTFLSSEDFANVSARFARQELNYAVLTSIVALYCIQKLWRTRIKFHESTVMISDALGWQWIPYESITQLTLKTEDDDGIVPTRVVVNYRSKRGKERSVVLTERTYSPNTIQLAVDELAQHNPNADALRQVIFEQLEKQKITRAMPKDEKRDYIRLAIVLGVIAIIILISSLTAS